jgi:toxin ParE1/3/4
MRYQVVMNASAERDLAAIHEYIATNDSSANADRVLDVLLGVVETLEEMPERGSHPRELLAMGRKDFRLIIRNPWNVYYKIVGKRVHIALIADGRRDLRTLLTQRLLGE